MPSLGKTCAHPADNLRTIYGQLLGYPRDRQHSFTLPVDNSSFSRSLRTVNEQAVHRLAVQFPSVIFSLSPLSTALTIKTTNLIKE